MSVRRRKLYGLGAAAVLAIVWLPLRQLAVGPFARHMVMHMAVVAVAAPLLALALAGGRFDPVARAPRLFSAIVASVIEMVAVWGWHAPALHHAARHGGFAFVLEQGTFLVSGAFLWIAALGGSTSQRRRRAPAGVVALLLTSMHMTLLGALIALSPRLLYGAHAPIADQHLGGVVMIFAGGVIYLVAGLGLVREVLAKGEPA